ncbi:hypothetical protein DSO57_1015368 [Entomophthora muscae]|uniref:Uncharacterized protein n=1 Tax=Entomophthora muscae TaxID=34485 RepID=A0ACC2S7H7_9FUNG|nr:hypothetical protein DSO57_1015368 [Entomophthora muscae]
MEGTQQQRSNVPVVCHSCGCPHRSKNRVSAIKVPTQEGDGRGEFNSDTALTQLVQGAQYARVWSINPWVPKLTWKPTKVTTTKTFRNKEPSNIDICEDLVGFAFNFGNFLPSANGYGSISTYSRLSYLSLTDPGMTSSQRDSFCHSVYLISDH